LLVVSREQPHRLLHSLITRSGLVRSEKDYTHPEDDVAYLIPYIAMVVDEHRETRDNLVDVFARCALCPVLP